MKTLRLEIELEYDETTMHADDPEGRAWFFGNILGGELILHSNEIGDEIGTVTILKVTEL